MPVFRGGLLREKIERTTILLGVEER